MNTRSGAVSELQAQHPIYEHIVLHSAICRALPGNAHVIMENLPQSIMATFIEAAGMSCDMVISEEALTKYGFQFIDMLRQAETPFTCLSATTSTLRMMPPVEAGFSGLSHGQEIIKVQTIDDAFFGLQKITWIALEHATIEHLHGAKACIDLHRPLLSLTVADIAALLDWCQQHQYIAVDSNLSSLPAGNHYHGKVYLFPHESLLKTVQALFTSSSQAKALMPSGYTDLSLAWPALCADNDKLARTTKAFLNTHTRHYPLKSMLAQGLYQAEISDGVAWRWTGPGHDTRILLPMRAQGYYRVALTVFALAGDVELTQVRCFMNGRLCHEQTVAAGSEIVFDYLSETPALPVELLLTCGTVQNSGGRNLGIAISDIQVSWRAIND